MKVEVITIGNELLLGFTEDTNSTWLSRELSTLGITVTRRSTVPDDVDVIASEMTAALSRTGRVVTTGGLGPTSDDRTRDAIAVVRGVTLVEDPSVVASLEELFRSRGYKLPLPVTNRRQALVPEGARLLPNRHGTAPGIFSMDAMGKWVVALPGVPREMRGIVADELVALLRSMDNNLQPLQSRTLRTTGIAESELAELIERSGLLFEELAYLPDADGVDLRITSRAASAVEGRARLDREMLQLREIAGEHAYGETVDMAMVVLELARKERWQIAVAESCTGGLLGARLTAVPGSSDVFAGGIIAYENRIKEKELGVPAELIREVGAVSEEVVRAMASGVRLRFGCKIGLAISGVAGPGGGSPEKPVGTVAVAADISGVVASTLRRLPGDREEVRRRATQLVLNTARVELLHRTG